MERELFDWEDWDMCFGMAMQFYNCRLKRDIGHFKAGTVVPIITIDFDNGAIQLFKDKDIADDYTEYKLRLEVY